MKNQLHANNIRKKSIEKSGAGGYNAQRISDGTDMNSPAGAPYQIYKHANGKIELRGIAGNGGGGTQATQ